MLNNQIKVQFVGTNRLLPYKQDYLALMDEISRSIVEIAINGREKTKPILLIDGEPLIFPRTINVIQGKKGSHKSRLAEVLSASFIRKAPYIDILSNLIKPLEFTRLDYSTDYKVIYIDTERDKVEQLPDSFQSIKTLSQMSDINEFREAFTITSVLTFRRNSRVEALRDYLIKEFENVSKEEPTNYVVVLDVVSDFMLNFNDIESTYGLMDLLIEWIDQYGVTFICTIHENPEGNKARGHLGTEISNKASSVLQVSLHTKSNNPEYLKITCMKSRSSAKFKQIFARFNSETLGLVRFDPNETSMVKAPSNLKAAPMEVVQYLEEILEVGEDYLKTNIFRLIKNKFNVKDRTIETRLKDITDNKSTFKFKDEPYLLTTRIENKVKKYKLERKI